MLTTDPLLLALVTLLLGIVLGVVLYRGDYCMVAYSGFSLANRPPKEL
ncbi:MAG: hypothetical protein ACYC9M_10870 [Desulfobulbaceae bacterium]